MNWGSYGAIRRLIKDAAGRTARKRMASWYLDGHTQFALGHFVSGVSGTLDVLPE
jgi:hypothetical protein